MTKQQAAIRCSLGILLLIIGIVVLAWHETTAVQQSRTRHILNDEVRPISAASWNKNNNGHLVYLTGNLRVPNELEDPVFNVKAEAVRMRRVVEMYQWIEMSEDGPRYEKEWSSTHHSHHNFQNPDGHENPGQSIPHGPWSGVAHKVIIGSFVIQPEIIRELEPFQPWVPDHRLPPEGWEWQEGYLTNTADADNPQVGDLRIAFETVDAGPVTLLAGQEESELIPWSHPSVASFYKISAGTIPLEEFLPAKEPLPLILPTLIRLAVWGGLVQATILVFSSLLALRVNAYSPSLTPIVRVLGTGAASILMLLLLAVAWMGRYLVVGLSLLVLMAGIGFLLFIYIRKNVRLT
jgi:hypothetical protein